MKNTLKTYMGFASSMVKARTFSTQTPQSLTDIFNFLEINSTLSTSGQPTEQGFAAIKNAGFEAVINLAPTSVMENALKNEPEILASLGLEYVHIPVDFIKPTEADFQDFAAALQAFAPKKVWIHCAANMRVSAFIYRYRIDILGDAPENAKKDLDAIWQPFGVWKKLIRLA